MAMRAWTRGAVPRSPPRPARARRARRSSSPARCCKSGRRPARRGRLPDHAAHAPVGARRRAPGGPPRARRRRRCARRATSTGVAVTYARVASVAERWARQCGGRDARHRRRGPPPRRGARLGRRASRRAFGAAARWLLLSGTPFRSDQCPIPGVRYDDGVADARRLLQLRRRRPRRHLPPGHLRPLRRRAAVAQRRRRSSRRPSPTRSPAREAGRRYRTAISVELADGLPRILAAAHERLEEVRAGGHRDAGGLVVAADGEHARAVAKVLRETSPGRAPTVVLHTEARAAEKLAGVHALAPTAGSSRSTWSARASTSRACASASTRRRPRRR